MKKQQSTEEQPAETQLVVIAEFTETLQETKIELTKAEQHAVAFAPSMQKYHELAAKIKDLNKIEPTETDAKIARENRLKMVKVRTSAEEIKDLRKEGIKAEGDLIQSLFNVVKNSCLVTENEFLEIEKHQERKEKERQEQVAKDRTDKLSAFGTDTTYLPLGIMTNEQFDRLLENEQLAFNARKEAAEKAEQARIQAERIAAEKEAERIRLAAEEQERIRQENERLKKEAEEREKQAAIEREAAAKEAKRLADIAEQERKKREAEIAAERAKQEAADKKAREEAEKLRKENEAKLAAERAERERIEAELRAKQEAEQKAEAERLAAIKAAEMAPDKEKINALFLAIKGLDMPEMKTDDAKKLITGVQQKITELLNFIKTEAKNLK